MEAKLLAVPEIARARQPASTRRSRRTTAGSPWETFCWLCSIGVWGRQKSVAWL